MERRTIFKGLAASGLALAGGQGAARAATRQDAVPDEAKQYLTDPAAGLPRLTDPGEFRGEMWYRRFGRTGETVSVIGLGGFHIGSAKLTDAEAVRLIHEAVDRGITYMDNSWDYNSGGSELRVGTALSQGGYRNKVFLMTKVDGRTKAAATKQLDESLQRLRTDHVDLWQFHEILRYEDPDRIFAENGAIHAALEARKAGKIRFIGYTGHKDPHIHQYMLEVAARNGFQFDAVLHPSNVMDAHYRSFAHEFMPYAVREGLAIQTMKPMGGNFAIFQKSGAGITPIECLHYAMNLPTAVVVTGIDGQNILDQAFEAARSFRPMDVAQVNALLAKTKQAGSVGRYELFKTTAHYDSTVQNPEWLGGPSSEVEQDLNG